MEKIRKARQPKETKSEALRFYIMGLTALEVERITGIPKRTLERYMMNENWKAQRQAIKDQNDKKVIEDFTGTLGEYLKILIKNRLESEQNVFKPTK
jgi:hypothetical protein